MKQTINIGEIEIQITFKNIKNVHLSVKPPYGHVTIAAPNDTRIDVAKAYAISKLEWIRKQQKQFRNQTRESPLEYIDRESHFLWGRRYLLTKEYKSQKPSVKLSNKKIILTVKPKSSKITCERIMHKFHRSLLHEEIPQLINKWEERLGVKLKKYYLQKMKTKWGSCNPNLKTIRINTELIKKPKDLLEYVVVHEIAHLLVPTHNEQFINILNKFYPSWKEARIELNELPIKFF